ncbi:MAG: hypothetical protein GY851_30385 [bacterium]|nr:hypothetical protein [bacterium]
MSRRTEMDEEALRQLMTTGHTYTQAAQALGVGRSSAQRRWQAIRGQPGPGRVEQHPNIGRAFDIDELCGPSTVGIIGDTHLPFAMPDYLDFCAETFDRWGCDRIVHVGDLFENHSISYHETDPDGMSAGAEREAALEAALPWYKVFPVLTWIIGNHDRLPFRRAFSAGMPASMLARNMYDAPKGWQVAESTDIDGVLYTHGTGAGGEHGAKNLARRRGVSCVMGHFHRVGAVHYTPTHDGAMRFGLAVGCGVDHDSYAQAWSRDYGRHALGCGVVRHGREAHFVPM